MVEKKPDKELSPEQIARRRDDTMRRMFATPPKPHKDEPKKAPRKPTT